jgi:PhoH-like ATPase
MSKTFVLDTCIIFNDFRNVLAFEDNVVVIPTVVLSEVDHNKVRNDEVGYHARQFSKLLDELRSKGRLRNGVQLESGGTLVTRNAPVSSQVYGDLGEITNDNMIIATALELQNEGHDVVLVSNDTLVRVRADDYVTAESFRNDRVIANHDEVYTGYTSIAVDSELVAKLKAAHSIDINSVPETLGYPDNHFFILNGFCLSRRVGQRLVKTYPYMDGVWGISPRNQQQEMALNLLMDKNVPIVTLQGKAGSGKTLEALAAGLAQTLDEKFYNKVMYMKPPLENEFEIGFLPGESDDKLAPHMEPAKDNLEVLFNCKTRKDLDKILMGYEGIISFAHIGFMRGRSLNNTFIIVDEAQNLSKHGAKTIITRLGEGSKVVLLGDPQQIDNRFVDAFSNGLTYVTERLKDLSVTGHVTLPKSERSTVADLAADLL